MEHGITAITPDFDSEDLGSIPDAPTKCILLQEVRGLLITNTELI